MKRNCTNCCYYSKSPTANNSHQEYLNCKKNEECYSKRSLYTQYRKMQTQPLSNNPKPCEDCEELSKLFH